MGMPDRQKKLILRNMLFTETPERVLKNSGFGGTFQKLSTKRQAENDKNSAYIYKMR